MRLACPSTELIASFLFIRNPFPYSPQQTNQDLQRAPKIINGVLHRENPHSVICESLTALF